MVVAFVFNFWTMFKLHILGVALALLTGRLVYRRYFSPLSSYPGPFLASLTRLWKVWVVSKGQTQHEFIQLHRKYGKLERSWDRFASPILLRLGVE